MNDDELKKVLFMKNGVDKKTRVFILVSSLFFTGVLFFLTTILFDNDLVIPTILSVTYFILLISSSYQQTVSNNIIEYLRRDKTNKDKSIDDIKNEILELRNEITSLKDKLNNIE